jgi:hypothetical protein
MGRHSHGSNAPVVAHLLEAKLCQMLNVLKMRLFFSSMKVLVESLVRIPIVRLRILSLPGCDLFLIDPNGAVLDPRSKSVLPLGGIVGTDSGFVAIIPFVEPAYEVLALDVSVTQ